MKIALDHDHPLRQRHRQEARELRVLRRSPRVDRPAQRFADMVSGGPERLSTDAPADRAPELGVTPPIGQALGRLRRLRRVGATLGSARRSQASAALPAFAEATEHLAAEPALALAEPTVPTDTRAERRADDLGLLAMALMFLAVVLV